MPLRIVRPALSHGGHPDDLVEVPTLPHHYYGYGLGCTCFTGTLAAVEEHERGCAHWLHDLLPEGLQRDFFSGDEDELALTLLDIVDPLQYPISMLQKAHRHALASPLLVASEEMLPLELADRHPAPSQKLPTSKQPTLPAAPASAPPFSSASISPRSLSLNLLPINPPSQTGDSNLVANKTINSSHKEKVRQQKARRHALTSPPLVAPDEMTPLGPADRHPAISQKLPTSKQPTPPAAPASASASIAPSPLSLNLLPINPPSQTGDSNFVAEKTIDSSHREKVRQQKARRHALASPPLVASDEMTPLGPANRHPAISQKLPTSKQPTPPAAPASAPPLSSASIAPSPLSLNLLPINPPSQTGDSHLVTYTTIDSSRMEKVQQQQGQDIGRPASNLVVKVTQSPAISPGHWGVCVEDEVSHPGRRVCVEVFASFGMLQRHPFSARCNHRDSVIPCSSTLVDRPPSLLPFPIDGHGQPLFSPESTSSHTDQVPIDEDSEEAIFAVQNTGSPAVKGNVILHTPVFPCLADSSSLSPFRRSDPPPSSTSTRFDDSILPTPHFSTRLPSPSSLRRSGSFCTRSGPPQQASSTPVARSSPSTLGAHSLSFSSLPSPQFSPSSPHPSPVFASLFTPSPPLPSLPTLLASLHSLLLHLRQVAQCSVPCPFLADIACHYVSLCRSLIFLPPPSFLFPSATGESTRDPGVFIIIIIKSPFWWLSYNKHSI